MFRFAMLSALLFLILAGCSHHHSGDELNRQLQEAARKGDSSLVESLLGDGANIEARDQAGLTPLALAVDCGNPQTAELLLTKGASMVGADLAGDDAFINAARNGLVHRTEFLLKRNPSAKAKNEALFALAMAAPVFVKVTVDPNPMPIRKPEDSPILVNAVQTAELLLANGGNLEAHDVEGATPLIRAASSGNTEIVKLLLDRGANLEARENNGETALIAAACECASIDMPETIDVLKLLVAKKADVNAKNSTGETALMEAADAGRTDNVRLLLDSGAQIDAADDHGNTALLLAASAGEYNSVGVVETADSVKLLLSRGANAKVRNRNGERAVALAVKAQRGDVASMLRSAMKR